ncbi:MAG: sugar phosphate isomerase/epimerase [Treponema sp.]|nr:sugar phosphate isomerase/epimerase [Treponema sp.]
MKLCIRPHDIGTNTTAADLGSKIHALGFYGVQLAIAKAIKGQNGSPETLSQEVIQDIRKGFNDNHVEIPILGAYFNPVHSDKSKVAAGQAKFADHLRKASLFGAKYVASETGSYNDEPWTYNPKNQTEEGFNEVLSVFSPLADTAKESGSYLTPEGAWHHCIYSPKQMNRLLKALDNGFVRTTVDIFNYLYIGNYEQRYDILHQCFELFADKIVIFHIKDFVHQGNELVEVPLGKGIMGWDKMIPEIRREVPQALLVFEGVQDLPNSLSYFKNLLD